MRSALRLAGIANIARRRHETAAGERAPSSKPRAAQPASISFSRIFTHARDNGRMRFRSLCFPLSPLFLIARLLHEIVRCQKIAG